MLPVAMNAVSAAPKAQATWALAAALLELPSSIVAAWAVAPRALGRRGTLFWAQLAGAGVLLLCAALCGPARWEAHWVNFLGGAAKLCLNCAFVAVIPYTAELFATDLRGTAVGVGVAAARVGAALAPWAVRALLPKGHGFPYFAFSVAAAAGAAAMLWLRAETAGAALAAHSSGGAPQGGAELATPGPGGAGGGGDRRKARPPPVRYEEAYGLPDDDGSSADSGSEDGEDTPLFGKRREEADLI